MTQNDGDAEILALVQRLKKDVHIARAHSLGHTEFLLKLVILELQMVLHSITDAELKEFSELLENPELARERA